MNNTTPLRKPKRFIKKIEQRFQVKGLLMYFLPIAAVPATLFDLLNEDLQGVIVNGSGYALFIYTAVILRRGLAAETDFLQKKIARPPKQPLKFYAAIITAITTGLIAWLGAGNSLVIATLMGLGAFLGMYLSYGFDPRREKSAAGNHGYSTEEIARTIGEAEQIISKIEAANAMIDNREFNSRINRICDLSNSILTKIEEDPGDIRRARKFLKIYLEGAQKVTEGYAKTHQQASSGELEQNFRNVLESIESVFLEQKEKLIANEVFDLDVQIEVLTKQLKQEGII